MGNEMRRYDYELVQYAFEYFPSLERVYDAQYGESVDYEEAAKYADLLEWMCELWSFDEAQHIQRMRDCGAPKRLKMLSVFLNRGRYEIGDMLDCAWREACKLTGV